MSPPWGPGPLSYHRVGRADLGAIALLDLDPEQMERYFDPLDDIVAAVRDGPAHTLFAIRSEHGMIGFYVLHPDRRDSACWWLGWFALDRHQQGRGYGRRVMARIMACFRRIPACRRVRLLVTADNDHALRLYGFAGFRRVGMTPTGDLILEVVLSGLARRDTAARLLRQPQSHVQRARQRCRPRTSPAAHAIRAIAIERGPPVAQQDSLGRATIGALPRTPPGLRPGPTRGLGTP
jgi:RimJ/RimL family protein N-acetyltransferase